MDPKTKRQIKNPRRASTNFAILTQTPEGREKLKAISRAGAQKVNQSRAQARINRITASRSSASVIPESAVPGGMAQAHAPAPVVDRSCDGLEPERLLVDEK